MCSNANQWEREKSSLRKPIIFLLPRLFYRSSEWHNLMSRAITTTIVCKGGNIDHRPFSLCKKSLTEMA